MAPNSTVMTVAASLKSHTFKNGHCKEKFTFLRNQVEVVRLSMQSLYRYILLMVLKSQLFFPFKGCGMGTLFVLVSPCFWENIVVTCKIGSFLCSLDNFRQKNLIVFFFGTQISKWRSFEKKGYF